MQENDLEDKSRWDARNKLDEFTLSTKRDLLSNVQFENLDEDARKSLLFKLDAVRYKQYKTKEDCETEEVILKEMIRTFLSSASRNEVNFYFSYNFSPSSFLGNNYLSIF